MSFIQSLSPATRIVALSLASALIALLLILSYLGGEPVDWREVVAWLGGLGLGVAGASGPARSGSSHPPVPRPTGGAARSPRRARWSMLALLILVALPACDMPLSQSPEVRCRWESALVEAAGAAVATLAASAPQSEEAETAIASAREAVGLGREAIRACQDAAQGRPTWQRIAQRILGGLRGLVRLAAAAGAPIPPAVDGALSVVSSGLSALAGPGAADAYGSSVSDPPSRAELERAREQLEAERLRVVGQDPPR